MNDKAAEEIGRLYRQACEGGVLGKLFGPADKAGTVINGTVTRERKIPPNMLRSRNGQLKGELSKHKDDRYRRTPDACHYCRDDYKPGQMRFIVLTAVNYCGGWAQASLCMDCFKAEDCEDSGTKLTRGHRDCEGCGEPMNTAINGRGWGWSVCSDRCYQRVYRKRARGHSAIGWKWNCGAQIAATNLARLEEVIQANHEGMRAKDQVSTTNYVRAISEINRMVGARGGDQSVTINNLNLGDATNKGINFDIEGSIRRLKFVSSPHQDEDTGPVPGGSTQYSAQIKQFPRLIEASDPDPVEEPKPAVRKYERPRPDPAPQGRCLCPLLLRERTD
jgi:hypothetical protein